MQNIATIFIVLLYSTISFAQNNQFVELKNGTIIEGNIERVDKIFQKGKLIINDTTEVLLQDVYRFQSYEGYYMQIKKGTLNEYMIIVKNGVQDTWAKRIVKGNIDLFTRTIINEPSDYWTESDSPDDDFDFMSETESSNEITYFSKNDGPLLKANAFNLKKHLNDNPVSMAYLKKRDELTAVQWVGAIAGLAIAGITLSNQSKKDKVDMIGPVIGISISAGNIWLTSIKKQILVENAINEYNN